MTERNFTFLDTRGLLAVSGADAGAFLQNLISNDMGRVSPDRTVYGTLLTPQGKFLHDFFVAAHPARDGVYLLDTEAGRLDDLERRLGMYRLRAAVTLERAASDWAVFAAFGDGAAPALGLEPETGATAARADGVAFVDPRLAALGVRAVGAASATARSLEESGFARTGSGAYDELRLSLGVPDGSRDILVGKSFPLECNLDALNAIDYDKGCYVGQELTARTRYRATIRKRLFPVTADKTLPGIGTKITLDGKEVGEMRSSAGGGGLALLRIESLKSARERGLPLMAGGAGIVAHVPAWMELDGAVGAGPARRPPPAQGGRTT